jgi:Phosphoribosylamine-glycine ligase
VARFLRQGQEQLLIIGKETTIEGAEKVAEEGVRGVSGKLFHRKDVGTKNLIQKRMDNMKKVRS